MTNNNNENKYKKYLYPVDRRTFLRHMVWWGITVIPPLGFMAIEGKREIDKTELTYHHIKSDKIKENLKIVHLTDLHLNDDAFRDNTIELINNQEPDLILMTGDYINIDESKTIHMSLIRDYVNKLKSRHGIYASFGNWDFGYEDIFFQGTKVIPIRDSFIRIQIGANQLNLIGLDYYPKDQWINQKTEKILKKIDSDTYNILLHHIPDLIEDIAPSGKVDLYLSGHTHGGQIRIPFLRYFTNDVKGEFPYYGAIVTLSKFRTKYQSGMFTVGNTRLFVGRGIGVGPIFPIRIFCKPEIGILDITPDRR